MYDHDDTSSTTLHYHEHTQPKHYFNSCFPALMMTKLIVRWGESDTRDRDAQTNGRPTSPTCLFLHSRTVVLYGKSVCAPNTARAVRPTTYSTKQNETQTGSCPRRKGGQEGLDRRDHPRHHHCCFNLFWARHQGIHRHHMDIVGADWSW